jgi:hypothetical protein
MIRIAQWDNQRAFSCPPRHPYKGTAWQTSQGNKAVVDAFCNGQNGSPQQQIGTPPNLPQKNIEQCLEQPKSE